MNFYECQNLKILDVIKTNSKKLSTPNCCAFCYQLKGETEICLNDSRYTVKAGCVYIAPAGTSFLTKSKQGDEFMCIMLDLQYNGEIRVFETETPIFMENLFKEVQNVWNKKEYNSIFLCLSVLNKIFAYTVARDLYGVVEDKNTIGPALKYINEHIFDVNLSLDEACGQAGVSRVYFNRLFLIQFNKTPVTYINERRIEKAQTLLKSGGYSREDIAALCGFKNLKYFYTVFKEIAGCTTGQYCKKNK